MSLSHHYRGSATKIDAALYKDVYAFWRKEALSIQAATGANMTFTLQPIPANIAKVGDANGGNPLGLPQIDHQWWTTLVDWQGKDNDKIVRAAPIATTAKWKELGEARGSYLVFLYMNDASRDQNPIAGYGASNVAKLRSVSKKYDPAQIFQTLQNGGFLLSKSWRHDGARWWIAGSYTRKRRLATASIVDDSSRPFSGPSGL
ncbi:MAG: hypothetical protein Q9181_003611 [Wetmoreana brouardii]